MSDDIEALVFLVMEQAAADANADLQSIMDELRKRRERIGRWRKAVADLTVRIAANPSDDSDLVRSARAVIADDLQSLSDMSEVQQMRLQAMLDRRSKFIEALSNIMKKQSDTASAIIKNMK